MAQPQPQQPKSGSGMGKAIMAAIIVAAIVIGVLTFLSHRSSVETTPKTDVVKELRDADYKKAGTKKVQGDGREILSETWERQAPPERVVISDDSVYTTPGVLVINGVTYLAKDGKPGLTCLPDPEHIRSPLTEIIADADEVRASVVANVKPDPEGNPMNMPYAGEFVGCKP